MAGTAQETDERRRAHVAKALGDFFDELARQVCPARARLRWGRCRAADYARAVDRRRDSTFPPILARARQGERTFREHMVEFELSDAAEPPRVATGSSRPGSSRRGRDRLGPRARRARVEADYKVRDLSLFSYLYYYYYSSSFY